MVIATSPGPSFKIKQIMQRKQEGFIIVDETGRFKIYQQSGEPKSPYFHFKDLPTTPDRDELWWE
jgi:hypothetical protein